MLAFFLLLFSALIFPIQDGDIFMYLAIARESIELGRIPALDPFLYTLRDWHVLHEWLSYFVWYAAYGVAGYAGVIIFKAGLHRAAEPISLLILFLGMKASSHRFIEKSSIFSDLLAVIVMGALLAEAPPWKKLRWIFPILFLAGVNLHPGFVIALADQLPVFGCHKAQRDAASEAFKLFGRLGPGLSGCLGRDLPQKKPLIPGSN